jgi:hypothetical protein
MNRTELLEFMKPRISTYYYEILEHWTKRREKTLFFFESTFSFEPACFDHGYCVNYFLEFLHVYP